MINILNQQMIEISPEWNGTTKSVMKNSKVLTALISNTYRQTTNIITIANHIKDVFQHLVQFQPHPFSERKISDFL